MIRLKTVYDTRKEVEVDVKNLDDEAVYDTPIEVQVDAKNLDDVADALYVEDGFRYTD